MNWLNVIERELMPLIGLGILFVFLFNNTKIDRTDKRLLFATIALEFVDIVFFELDVWLRTFTVNPSKAVLGWHTFVAVGGYVVQPLIIYFMILMTIGKVKGTRNNVLLLLPAIINFVILMTTFFCPVAFEYDANNVFQRGVLGFTIYAMSGLYLIILVTFNIIHASKRARVENFTIYLGVLFLIGALLIYNFQEPQYTSWTFRAAIVMNTFVYYLFLQNKKLFSLIDEIPSAIVTGKIEKGKVSVLTFNDTICRMFGLNRDEYRELTKENIIPYTVENDKKLLDDMALKLQTQDIFECEFKVEAPSFEKFFMVTVQVSSRINNIIYVTATLVDITKTKTEEEKNRLHEQEFSLIMSQIGKMICVYDIATKTLKMPISYANAHGFDVDKITVPDDVLAKDIIDKSSVEVYKEFYNRILSGEKTGKDFIKFNLQDGSACWEQVDFITIYDAKGVAKRAIVHVEDVTEAYERQLAVNRYRSTLSNLVGDDKFYFEYDLTANMVITNEGNLIPIEKDFSSKTLKEILQYLLDNIVRSCDAEYIAEILNRERMIASYIKGKNHRQIERIMSIYDGSEKWIRISIDISTDVNTGNIIALILFENVDTAHQEQIDLLSRANTDSLTGLLTRNATMSEIEEYLSSDGKDGAHALVMLDMDNLKGVNDGLGHQFGDNALKDFAEEVKKFFRSDDIIGRIGGDEFFVFVKNVSENIIAQKIAELLPKLEMVYTNNGKQAQISASAGIAMYYGKSDVQKTVDELYQEADTALYKSKRSGKRTYSF